MKQGPLRVFDNTGQLHSPEVLPMDAASACDITGAVNQTER